MYRVFFLNPKGCPMPLVAVHMCIVNARRAYKGFNAVEYSEELNDNDYTAISFIEFVAIGNNGKTLDEVAQKYAKRPMVLSALTALEELGVHSFAARAFNEQ